MSTEVLRLCKSIIREDFGDIVVAVASILLNKGRLPLSKIRALSKLTLKQTSEALFVLCQHRVVTWAETESNGQLIVHYKADPEPVLKRLLHARIISGTETTVGNVASEIMRVALRCGRITLPETIREVEQDGENHLLEFDVSREEVSSVFTQLVTDRFLLCDVPENALTVDDKNMASDARELGKIAMVTDKDVKTVRSLREKRAQVEREAIVITGMKRKTSVDDGVASKRRRTAFDYEEVVDDSAYWIVNYDKFLVRLRSESIVELMTDKLNREASSIVKAVLEIGEDRIKSCRSTADNGRSSGVGTHQIGHKISSDIQMQDGLYLDEHERRGKPNYTSLMADVLCQDQSRIFLKADEKGGGTYQIHLERAAKLLRQRVIESIVQEKFGSIQCRLIRILQQKGKLEEKQLAKLAMLPLKEAREKLLQLAESGVIELQEVPKSNDRMTSRTFFLWFFNFEKFCGVLVQQICRTLANIRQRRNAEKGKRQRLLSKLERQDVQENPDLLTDGDREAISEYEAVMEIMEVAEMRVEDSLRTLWDY